MERIVLLFCEHLHLFMTSIFLSLGAPFKANLVDVAYSSHFPCSLLANCAVLLGFLHPETSSM